MKIELSREELLRPLTQIVGVVERRHTLPILGNVLFTARGNELDLTATDMEVALRSRIDLARPAEGEFTVPARKLLEICKALSDDAPVCLDVADTKAVLRSGRAKFVLGVLPGKDYPSIEASVGTERFAAPAQGIKRLIDKTQFAMAHQDVRYYLNGLLLELTGDKLRTVATDGHRLAMCDGQMDNRVAYDIQVIIPRKGVLELSRLIGDCADVADFEISNSHLQVQIGRTLFITKLIDGRFPDYERVVPEGPNALMIGSRDLLKQALLRTSILSNEKYRGIRFRLDSNSLQLQAHNPEQEEAEEEIEVEYSGARVSIGFNVSYLLDVLGVLEGDNVEVGISDANSSCVIQEQGGSDYRYVVMPMRL